MRHSLNASRLLAACFSLLLCTAPRADAQPATSQPTTGPARPIERIAFGSCADQTKPQPVWDKIVEGRPDVFISCGNLVYADTENMDVLRYRYAELAAVPGFAALRGSTRMLATWNDHDYGDQDAGAEYPKRAESEQVFLDFWGEPADSPRRKREGVYDATILGPPGQRVQIIMLDTRYFRSALARGANWGASYVANNDPASTILGDEQWRWLETQFKSPAEIRIVVSSIQFIAEQHGFEKWQNFPRERDRMLKLIRETGAKGVVFISGDRESAELSKLPADEQPEKGLAYPLYDVTTGALNLNRRRVAENNRYRVGDIFWLSSFGAITFDWTQADPAIRFEIRNVDGLTVIQHDLRLSELSPPSKQP